MKFCSDKIQNHLLNGGKIKRTSYVYSMFLNESSKKLSYKYRDEIIEYSISKDDLTANDWEIVKPEYDWNKIIKNKILCVFGNIDFDYKLISTLRKKEDNCFLDERGIWYKSCKPFNPADFNIAKNIKEYEK